MSVYFHSRCPHDLFQSLGNQASKFSPSVVRKGTKISAAVRSIRIRSASADVIPLENADIFSKDEAPKKKGKRLFKFKNPAAKDSDAQFSSLNAAAESLVQSNRLDWLRREGVDLQSHQTLARVNRCISRCTSVSEALRLVDEMKAVGINAANEGTFLSLIVVCRRQRQGERALVVYEAMRQSGVEIGLLTFNTLLSCCMQALKLQEAMEIKAEMERRGVFPDVVSYTTLIALVAKANPYRGRRNPRQRFEIAMSLFTEMQMANIPPDVITFNTLMNAASHAKLPGKVMELYGMLIASGTSPSSSTFLTLLESVSHEGRFKAASQVFNEMRAMGIAPSTKEYNLMIQGCARAPQPDPARAWAFFVEMEANEESAKQQSSSPSLSSSLPSSPLSLPFPSSAPNAETFLHLIDACCKGGDHEGAMRAFNLLRQRRFLFSSASSPASSSPSLLRNPSLFNRLIHSAGMTGSAEKAYELYDLMRSLSLSPDSFTFCSLISACARDRDVGRAKATWEEMEREGVEPTQALYHSLMCVYGQSGDWKSCVETFHKMKEECLDPPSLASFTIAFDSFFAPFNRADDFMMSVLEEREGEKERNDKPTLDLDSPAMQAAIALYHEGVALGMFKNFSSENITRCDVRYLTRAAALVCILSWVQALKTQVSENKISELVTECILVIGSDRGRNVVQSRQQKRSTRDKKPTSPSPLPSSPDSSLSPSPSLAPGGDFFEVVPRGKLPKLFLCCERTLQVLGIEPRIMKTLTMQALSFPVEKLSASASPP